jgi:RNase P/RNase MRP subunit p29
MESSEMISKIELVGKYSVVIENNEEKRVTQLGVEGWIMMFTSKQQVVDHIELLNKALEFWEFNDQ